MPKKHIHIVECDMTERQKEDYNSLVEYYSERNRQKTEAAAEAKLAAKSEKSESVSAV